MTREEAIERFENVKANALVQKASGVSEYWQNEIDGTIEAIDMAIEALSADSVQGEWIEVEDYNGDVHYKCDQCGEEWTFPYGSPKENNANYCPNCGSRMEK